MAIKPGRVNEVRHVVQENETAMASGGADFPPVLSTPRLIGLMEATAHEAIADDLEPGQGSVGSAVNIRHLAATPVGMEVRVRAELLEVGGRRLRFKVEAWDAVEKIGEGEHERFIIERDRFNQRIADKRSS